MTCHPERSRGPRELLKRLRDSSTPLRLLRMTLFVNLEPTNISRFQSAAKAAADLGRRL